MISPVSSAQSSYAPQAPSSRIQAPSQKSESQPPQDTITLSSAVRGGGDLDHDGDSH